MAAQPPNFTVLEAMIACGIDNNALFDGETQAARIASDIFDDTFTTCMDKSFKELDADFKTYSDLTQAQGQIRLLPGVKKRVKAFIQWSRDQIRQGLSPSHIPFPANETASLIRRYKTHQEFLEKSDTLASAAKPKQFTDKDKWDEWEPTFINYLRSIPGRDGVPLKYVCRENDAPDPTPQRTFLDEYVSMAPLNGEAFTIDAAEVHTLLVSFISGNATAESKIQGHTSENNGRLDYIALKEHYEGVGILAMDITAADKILESLYYTGEKRPHMWWDEFERQLTQVFVTYNRKENRVVHSESMKLRILLKKVKADFLSNTKATISVELNKSPMTMTYAVAMKSFRDVVNQKFSPDMGGHGRRRHINETDRGRNSYSGKGRVNGGRGKGNKGRSNPKRTRTDSDIITLTDGQKIEYHASFRFPRHIFEKFREEDKDRLRRERTEYKRRRVQETNSILPSPGATNSEQQLVHIQQLERRVQQMEQKSHTNDQQFVPNDISIGRTTQVSQVTSPTMMGGRNDQAAQRHRRNGFIGAVTSKREISQTRMEVEESAPNTMAENECDTNADTCVFGKNFCILAYSTRKADVYSYDKKAEPTRDVPIVQGATAYDCQESGMTYILVFNEGLFYGSRMDHSLINPNQVRHYGLEFWDNPYDRERGLKIASDDGLVIPMYSQGTKIMFRTRVPTREELEECPHITMTSPRPWEPSEVVLQEANIRRPSITDTPLIQQLGYGSYAYSDATTDEAILHEINPVLVTLKELAISKVQVNEAATNNQFGHDVPERRTFVSTERHTKVTEDTLAERFGIGIQRARATLRVTTQRGMRSAILPIARRYKADRFFQTKRLNGKFATDTLYGPKKSLNANIGTQLYTHKCGFNAPYHLSKVDGQQVGFTLNDFIFEYGAPEHLTFDGAMVQRGRGTHFMSTIRKADIRYHVSAPRRPNENPAEASIREVKKRWYRLKAKRNIPNRLWDFGISYVCETGNITVSSSRYAKGRTPIEVITGITPDITEYLDFGFYDWVVFKPNAGVGAPELGRWLGISHRIGQMMSYWILPESGIPISCSTVQRLTQLEQQTDEWKGRMASFTEAVTKRLDAEAANIGVDHDIIQQGKLLNLDMENEEFIEDYKRVIDSELLPHAEEQGGQQNYVGMELGIRRGDDALIEHGIVKRRITDEDGRPVGRPNNNPILDTTQYEVEFEDGEIETMAANTIAENILAQVDEEGHRQMFIDEIVDHRVLPNAIPKGQGTFRTANGLTRKKRTTRGWELCAQWKDGSTDWIALKDLKDSYPIELAEYAANNGLTEEPAFAWWVPYTLKKRTRIIKKLKSKYWQRTHKYGIRIPKSIGEAKEIDRNNGNTLWMDAIQLEMKNLMVAFEEHDGDPNELIGYQEITGHLVFDVKLGENFRRKARFCADGHKTNPPASITYSTVVSRDSVRIVLLIAALNGLDLKGADLQNAFLTAPNREKMWIKAGPEFGEELQGKTFIVVRALYGLKSAGASFRAFVASKLDEMGFKSCPADPDVWMRPAVKADGEHYYEYILSYVDDILGVSEDATQVLQELQRSFKFKNDKIEDPENYLGAKLKKKNINGRDCWTITSVDYVKAAITNVESSIEGRPWKVPSRATTPMMGAYTPELDGTPELDKRDTQFFQELIGILRWATEIGRVDILHEVSLLSQYQACPRQGHLEQALHIFGYLKRKPKVTLYMDPGLPIIDYELFKTNAEDFKEIYREAEEVMPHDMPVGRGRPVYITAFVDASHAANRKTRRSHTGFIVFVNRAPIHWYSKRQQTVESSAFSSELIAMRTCVETIQGLRYKLRMFGVPLPKGTPSHIFCDNESVVKNSTRVESTLNKKHSSVAYHYIRWCVTAGIISVAWVRSQDNLSDALTKRLSETVRDYLFGNWTY